MSTACPRGCVDTSINSPVLQLWATSAVAGLMTGVEIVQDKATRAPFPPAMKVGPTFDRIAFKNGLIVRCMGDTLGMSPPLIIQEAEVDEIAEKFSVSLRELEQIVA